MVAPCGCRVLLDTDGQNPTSIYGRVKPFSAGETTQISASVALAELIGRIGRRENVSVQDLCQKRLRYARYEPPDSQTSRSSFNSPNMIPSTHSP